MGRAFEYRRASKEKRWDKMSKLFPKLAKAITLAAKEGGSEPDSNAKLRAAILYAKSQNLPKDNIEAAIKRATTKDTDLSEVIYEIKAPFGVMMIVECASDNATRTIANIKSYCNKHHAQVVPNGSLEFMFDRKAVFKIEVGSQNLDDVELELIDYGLESLQKSDEGVFLYANYKDFGEISNALKNMQIEVLESSLQYIARSPISLEDCELAELEKLLYKIEDDDDVQQVYTNIN